MPSSRDKIIDGILEWLNKALTLGQNISSMIPLPAFGPISTVLIALKARTNKKAAADVLGDIQTLSEIIGISVEELNMFSNTSLSEMERETIQAEFHNKAQFRDPFKEFLKDLQRLKARSGGLKHKYGWLSFVFSSQDAAIIKEIQDGVSKATKFFKTRCLVETRQYLQVINDRLADIRSEVKAQADRVILESIPHADTSYRASNNDEKGEFLEGTRAGLFAELEKWTEGSLSEKRICILSGPAGTGKSTIASELAKRLDKEGKLGASFFFNRGITDLDSTRVFFSTIAYQLANWTEGTLRQPIIKAAQEHLKKGTSLAMKYQALDLLHAPLRHADQERPIFIVIDALDECTQEASKRVPEMLDLLITATRHGPLRIFLTSRPDPLIEYKLQDSQWENTTHTISTSDYHATGDVEKFVEVRLREIVHGSKLLDSRPGVAGHLAERAQGLFIYARTVMDFLRSYTSGTLDEGVNLILSEEESIALDALDQLYLTILTIAFPPDGLRKSRPHRERVQFFLACIALHKEPITPQFLESLTSPTHAPITCQNGDLVLDRLRAVIIFKRDEPNEEFRTIHATFPQFLVDKARCTNELYLVDPQRNHARMAEACLRTVLTLDENMCKLEQLEQLEQLKIPEHLGQSLQQLQQLRSLPRLLPRWERLERMERRERLEQLERLERLEQQEELEQPEQPESESEELEQPEERRPLRLLSLLRRLLLCQSEHWEHLEHWEQGEKQDRRDRRRVERLERLEQLVRERLEEKKSELRARFLDSLQHLAGDSSPLDPFRIFNPTAFSLEEEHIASIITNSTLVEMLLPLGPPPEHVLYACNCWAAHLREACKPDEHQDKECSCGKHVEGLQRFVRDWDNLRRTEIINLMSSHQTLEVDLNDALNWLPPDSQYDALRSELEDTTKTGFRAPGFEGLDIPRWLEDSFAVAAKKNRPPRANA